MCLALRLRAIPAADNSIRLCSVGRPATNLTGGRARFCVSAAHTKDDLDRLLRACDDVGGILGLKYTGKGRPIEEVIANATQAVMDS